MRLIHYTDMPIEVLEPRIYEQKKDSWKAKPTGFWFSVEISERLPNNYNWKEWCESEKFCLESLVFSYEITLKESANVLHLKTEQEILEFTKQFRLKTRYWDAEWDTDQLEWDEVKKKYQGIIISPYQWSCRLALETSWYYTWDCSSGCIWDLNCIEKFLQQDNESL
jgi:hypothetical protein